MIAEDRSIANASVKRQLARTWVTLRRALLLSALVPTGIGRAAITVSREFFTNTAGALAAQPPPASADQSSRRTVGIVHASSSRLRAAFAWPFRQVGQLLSPAEDRFKRLDRALARML